MWAGGCGPGPQDNVDVQDRACGPLQPCVLTLMVSPRDQSTLRTLLGREPGAPSLGLVGEQRGAHLPVGQPPPPMGWTAELRQAICPSLSQPWALAHLWSPEAQDGVSSGRFLVGRRWVTFEHRYQTVLESSQEIQHCPVRCPQRPRCPSARGQGQTAGAHPWAGRVQWKWVKIPGYGGLSVPPCFLQSRETWGRRPRTKAGDAAGPQGGPPIPGWAFVLQSPLLSPAQPTPARCGGSICSGAVGRTQMPERPNPGSVCGGGCSRRCRTAFMLGGHEAWEEGSHFCPVAPPGRMGWGNFGWVG